ncbi:MAG: hypothetical protein FJ125_04945, partial [Deltaproteobacteria bacterium]|nr:hypothetical protein [Deltaproteobacteria bacterium]
MGGGRHIPSAPLSGSLDGHPLAGSTSELEAAARFLQDGSHFVVAAHRGPDGDAIGSILAMGGVLELMGKEVHRYCCDPVPYPYFFLEGADRCSRQLPDKGAWRIVLLDCSGLDRAGTSLGRFAKGLPLLIVDHHLPTGPQVQAQEQVIFSDQESAAVGMLVERLANALNVELTLGIAEAIYATVISDTGSFHYSNTSAAALRCCARMLEKGVDPWRVASHLYEAEPLARIKLL